MLDMANTASFRFTPVGPTVREESNTTLSHPLPLVLRASATATNIFQASAISHARRGRRGCATSFPAASPSILLRHQVL